MVRALLLTIVAALILGGCTSNKVIDIDPTKLDSRIYGSKPPEVTPDHVMVGMKSGIAIDVDKIKIERDPQYDVELQVWKATATNFNETPKCVTVMWRLMDFEYISFGPSEQLVPALTAKKMGELRQQYWEIDGARVAFPPSGYLSSMRVRDPVPNAKLGEECMHLTPEEDVETTPSIEK